MTELTTDKIKGHSSVLTLKSLAPEIKKKKADAMNRNIKC